MRYLYFLKAGEYYKVGVATDLKARVGSIQSGNATRVHIVCARLMEQAARAENELHAELSDRRGDGGSEWFLLSEAEALDVCMRIYAISDSAEKKPKLSDIELSELAMEVFRQRGYASTSLLQRHFGVGYGKASRVMDILQHAGLVPEPNGTKPRVLLDYGKSV